MGKLQVNGDIIANGTISASSFLGNASSATYTYQFRVSATNPCTASTDSNTGIFNVPGSRIYWITQTDTVIDQLSQWGYILDIGNYSERHQIWMTQSSGDMAHRGGNSNGWNGTWRILLDSSNYTSYTVTKTGSGASGTWGINITGTWQGYNPSSFALASHSHSYLPLSGGTITGRVLFTSHNWTSAPDVDNAPLCFDYKIDAITSSTYYKPWFGGSHGISGQGYYATITAGLYHTNNSSRGGFYIGASWDMNPSDTFYYFSRDGHFITPRLVTNNYGSSFPSVPYTGEVFYKI